MNVVVRTHGKRSPRRQEQRRVALARRSMRPSFSQISSSENTHYYINQQGMLFEAVTTPPSGKSEGRVDIFTHFSKKEKALVGEGFFQLSRDGSSVHLYWVTKRSVELKSLNPRHKIKDKGIDLARPVIDACMREAIKRGLKKVTLTAPSSLESYYTRFGFHTLDRSRTGDCSMVLEW
ncbi:MAG: hypothetical protein AABX02_02660 [archaeon]